MQSLASSGQIAYHIGTVSAKRPSPSVEAEDLIRMTFTERNR